MPYRRDCNAFPIAAIHAINAALAHPALLPAADHLRMRRFLNDLKQDLQRPLKPRDPP